MEIRVSEMQINSRYYYYQYKIILIIYLVFFSLAKSQDHNEHIFIKEKLKLFFSRKKIVKVYDSLISKRSFFYIFNQMAVSI